jgi:PqqD family protein of HPr-rel-A system
MKIKENIAVSDTGFVFDPSTGDSFTVNETGQEILNMLKQGKSYDEISTQITASYDIDRGSFERYYQDFIEMLNHYHLIDYEG